MMGNKNISFSRHEGIFQNNASYNLSLTEGNVMNMEMDKQGRNMRFVFGRNTIVLVVYIKNEICNWLLKFLKRGKENGRELELL
jgi:hypothetical protein